MELKKIILGIHDLNPWGGQEKSNLEIFYRINQNIPIDLHTYSFDDSRSWPQLNVIQYSKKFTQPSFLKFNHFHASTLLNYYKNNLLKKNRRETGTLIQSTGAALPLSDVIQVQFVQKSWYQIQDQLPHDVVTHLSPWHQTHTYFLRNLNLIHEKLLFTNQKKFIAVSHGIKKELMEHYNIKGENIRVLYHGVDAQQFTPSYADESQFVKKRIRYEYNIPDEAFVITTVGALNARKGLHTLLNVLHELQKNDFKQVVLMAVGGGHSEIFKKYAENIGLNQNQFRIIPAQKNIAPFYQASDLFMFPTHYEPFGLVLLEAMASGLPVISSGVAGAAELLTHGKDGAVLPKHPTVNDIVFEIADIIKNKDKRNSLSLNARLSAEKWTWDNVAKEHLNFYKSL